jgi:pimeloyl-ACP methyl ester carboxylesterase
VAADIRLAGEGWDHEGDERFDAATDQFKQFQRMYHPFDITVTGHSLGGSQAMWVGTQNPLVRTVIFNAGVVTPTGAQALRSTLGVDDGMGKPLNNVTLLRADGDVVSGGWMAYNNPEELKDDQGRGLVASKDPQNRSALVKAFQASVPDRWVHQYAHGNGMKLVNIKGKEGGSAHSLDNFLTEEQTGRLNEAQEMLHFGAEPKTYSHDPPISHPSRYESVAPVDIPRPIEYHAPT